MSSKHTLGPWYSVKDKTGARYIVSRSTGQVVAKVKRSNSKANSRFVSFAIEMYKLIEDLSNCTNVMVGLDETDLRLYASRAEELLERIKGK